MTAANATQPGDTTGTATVSWQPPASNGGSPIINYTAVSSPSGVTAITNSGQSSVPVTGLTIGTSYTFTVYATNAVGSGPSNAVTPTPVGTPSPPQAPGAATLDQSAYVSCLPPATDGSTPIVSYIVTSSPGGITATGPSDEPDHPAPAVRPAAGQRQLRPRAGDHGHLGVGERDQRRRHARTGRAGHPGQRRRCLGLVQVDRPRERHV